MKFNKSAWHMPGKMMLLFALEGMLFQFVTTLAGSGSFGVSLYATNLGATASQIGMLQLIPNLAAMVMLLPAGLIADRTKSAKTLPVALMLILTGAFVLFGSIPMLPEQRMTAFFLLLPFTAGVIAIYNSIWQAFFGDVTPIEDRSRVYAFRSRFLFIVGTVTPILCGMLLTSAPTVNRKLSILQIFFYLCAALTLLNALTLSRIPGGRRAPEALRELPKFSLRSVGGVLKDLSHDRKFLAYFIPIIFLYIGWQADWSMWYIGQVEYIGMTEAELSVCNAVVSIIQLATLGLYVRFTEKHGPMKTLFIVLVTFVIFPYIMVSCSFMPAGWRSPMFILFTALLCSPQAAVNLCLVQMLLDAAPEKNRSLVVSLNMMFVTLSNALMPYLGVQLYNLLGGDHPAMIQFFVILSLVRFAVAVLFFFKIRRKKEIA